MSADETVTVATVSETADNKAVDAKGEVKSVESKKVKSVEAEVVAPKTKRIRYLEVTGTTTMIHGKYLTPAFHIFKSEEDYKALLAAYPTYTSDNFVCSLEHYDSFKAKFLPRKEAFVIEFDAVVASK